LFDDDNGGFVAELLDIEPGTVVRTWVGWIRSDDRDACAEYLERTRMRDYRATPGNLGAFLMFAYESDGRTRVTTMSFWTSMRAIEAFAGADIQRAVFYPEDDVFLIARETSVTHHEVAAFNAAIITTLHR
jgi:heme-degrading monooxygenase HmoA